HDRDIQADQGADIGRAMAIVAENLDSLPDTGNRGHDLLDARILGPGIGIDLAQNSDLMAEIECRQRVFLAIEDAIGADRRQGKVAAMTAADSFHGLRGALDRLLAQIAGMGVAMGLPGDGPQAESLGRVESRAFQLAIVIAEAFRLAVFEEQLAIL